MSFPSGHAWDFFNSGYRGPTWTLLCAPLGCSIISSDCFAALVCIQVLIWAGTLQVVLQPSPCVCLLVYGWMYMKQAALDLDQLLEDMVQRCAFFHGAF